MSPPRKTERSSPNSILISRVMTEAAIRNSRQALQIMERLQTCTILRMGATTVMVSAKSTLTDLGTFM